MDANIVDIAVIAVLLLSGLFAMMRGFVQEVLSVAGWIGAALVALYGLPEARPIAQKYISSPTMADVAAGGVLFLVTLVVLSIITHFIAKQVRGSMLSHLDRSLGFVFGLARGALIACLAFLLALFLYTPEPGSKKEAEGAALPSWLTAAKSRPYLERGAIVISSVLPEAFDVAEARTRQMRDGIEAGMKYQDLVSPKPRSDKVTPASQPGSTGYDNSERKDMDRLIRSTQ